MVCQRSLMVGRHSVGRSAMGLAFLMATHALALRRGSALSTPQIAATAPTTVRRLVACHSPPGSEMHNLHPPCSLDGHLLPFYLSALSVPHSPLGAPTRVTRVVLSARLMSSATLSRFSPPAQMAHLWHHISPRRPPNPRHLSESLISSPPAARSQFPLRHPTPPTPRLSVRNSRSETSLRKPTLPTAISS